MRRAYWVLLQLYPRDYKVRLASEMARAFESSAEDAARDGRKILVRFVLAEFAGLVTGAVAEWMAKFTTSPMIRGRGLPDLQVMRPVGVGRAEWFGTAPEEVVAAQQRVDFLVGKMVHAIANHDFPGARSYSNQEREAREELRQLQSKYGIAS